MGRHAHDIGRVRLNDPIQAAHPGRRVVGHQLTSRHQPLRRRDPGNVMRQRRQAEQNGLRTMPPIARQIACIRQQRIVGMHHAFRRSRRARREGEIADFVGVFDGF